MLASTSSSSALLQQQHAGRQSLHVPRNPLLLVPSRRLRVAPLGALRPNQSFGEESDLDADLAAELRARNDPKRADAERMAQHYDLLWKATKSRGQVQKCSCCSGTGEKECDWCHGTGFMTVGDRVFTGGKNECPVCKAKGYVKCDFCRGTGSRAQWMPNLFDSQKQGGGASSSGSS